MKDINILVKDLLCNNLTRAVGCTEPAAIGYAAACARKYSKGELKSIEVLVSANILKNAMAVQIPQIRLAGINYAAALGFVIGNPGSKLALFSEATEETVKKAGELVQAGKIGVNLKNTDKPVYIEITVKTDENSARVVIEDGHTNIGLIEVDGRVISKGEKTPELKNAGTDEDEQCEITIKDIYRFVNEYPLHEIELLDESIRTCREISRAGIENQYGLEVGRLMNEYIRKGIIKDDLATYAAILTAAACDARMAGINMPVIANSGSGNQGISAAMPLIAVSERIMVPYDKLRKAVAMSHLMTMYIKKFTGPLSSVCGAVASATGAGCGIVILMDGGLSGIYYAIQNVMGNLTGMICDGAKASCALKVYTCTNAAVQAALMAIDGKYVKETDGFIETSAEKTIRNYGFFAKSCSPCNDKVILDLMISKLKVG